VGIVGDQIGYDFADVAIITFSFLELAECELEVRPYSDHEGS
jgi:hypothetical protein